MIHPALFIGLGSTGLRILSRFQELIVEHYDNASLPIFQYICLETEMDSEIEIPPWVSSKIKVIHTTVPSTGLIRNQLNDEKKYLKSWLDDRLLSIPEDSFEHGASNIRMAGRLCLWENWDKIKLEFDDAMKKIKSGESRAETEELIKRRYQKIGKVIPQDIELLGRAPNIFITGTLCGGTCSGMFVDVGYYLKSLFNIWTGNVPVNSVITRVIGIFTILDSSSLKTASADVPVRRAANCWAGLTEYDYWCHKDSEYEVRWPDDTKIEKTNEKPIDWVYLLSCTGTKSNLYDKEGVPNIEALAHSAAMVLFTDNVGYFHSWKEGRRTDFRSGTRVFRPNKNEHMASLATCGIAAVWYPKFRIAESAAYRYSVDNILKKWKGESPNSDDCSFIGQEALQIWQNVIEDKRGILTSRGGERATLYELAKKGFSANEKKILALSPEDLKRELNAQLEKLNEGATYDKEIKREERQENFKSELEKALEEVIVEKLNGKKNVAYCHTFLEKLDEEIEKEIGRLPKEYPQRNFSLSEANIVVDEWCKFVGRSKKVLNMMKTELLKDTESKMLNQIEKIRDFRMKPCLNGIRAFLGVKKQLPNGKIQAGSLSIKSKLDNLDATLNSCIETFQKRAEDRESGIRQTRAIQLITEKQPAGSNASIISGDVEKVYFKLNEGLNQTEKKDIIKKILADDTTPVSKFLGYGNKELQLNDILTSIHMPVFKTTIGLVGGFDVVREWSKRYDAREKRNFASLAEPLLELSGRLGSVELGDKIMPEIIIGKDNDDKINLNAIKKELVAKSAENSIQFQNTESDSELDYLLFFYKEEGLIYMDENLVTSALFREKYEKELIAGNSYGGLHTHKGGPLFFDIWMSKRRKEAKEFLLPIARELLSKRDLDGAWQDSEIFGVEDGNLILRFERDNETDGELLGTPDMALETLAEDKEIFDFFKDKVLKKIEQIGEKGYKTRLNNYLTWVEKIAKNQGKHFEDVFAEKKANKNRHVKIMEYALKDEEKDGIK